MNDIESQFKKDADRVHLFKKEKDAVRMRIMGTAPSLQASPYARHFWMQILAAPLMLFILAGPVTYAAQASGPGDLLYGIEISVVEPIEESLHVGHDSRERYHTQRLEERLDEVQDAQAEGTIDQDDQETVARNVEDHVEALVLSLAQDSEPEQKIPRLVKAKALVEAHEELLDEADVATSSDSIDDQIENVSDTFAKDKEDAVEAVADAVADIQEDALDTASTTSPAIKGQLEDIAEAIQDGDLGEALYLATETQANQLKDRYLSDKNSPDSSEE